MSSFQSTLRKDLRTLRRSLTIQQQANAAGQIASQLERHLLFQTSRSIAFYWPNDGEIDLTRALISALKRSKKCYLPILYRGGENRLLFGRITSDSKMKRNRFGIPEPSVGHRDLVFSNQLDLVLAPLVAFDDHGNRIGMGGGFYDRSLGQLQLDCDWQRPYVLGVAHEFQHVESIGRNAWDIPLRGAVTDQRIYHFQS